MLTGYREKYGHPACQPRATFVVKATGERWEYWGSCDVMVGDDKYLNWVEWLDDNFDSLWAD